MIKKLIHSIAKVSLISGLTIITSLSLSLKTWALPTEQIIKTLQQIPVFVIVDEQGVPLVRQIEDKDKKKFVITYIFISQSDANQSFENLKQKNPEIAKKVKVHLISLGDVYKVQNSQTNPKELLFLYVPIQKQVEEAKKVSAEAGQEYKGGVPLFVLTNIKNKGYVTIKKNDQEIVPLLFEAQIIQKDLTQIKKDKPDLAADLKIEVITLETFIANLKESNDENLTKFVLFPSEEMIKTIQSVQTNPANQQTPPPQSPQPNLTPQTTPSNN